MLPVRHITIVEGHPDTSPERLNHALAERYAQAAERGGAEVRRIAIGKLDFPFIRTAEQFWHGDSPTSLAQAQQDLVWADHIALFYPLWQSDMPALCKAFIEQTFRPRILGKSFRKSFRFIVTMGMPAFVYRSFFGAHSLKSLERSLSFFGAGPIDDFLVGNVEHASERKRAHWFARMEAFGKSDARRQTKASAIASASFRAIGGASVVASAAYLAHAASTWLQYGRHTKNDGDLLLDFVMPDYDVSDVQSIDVAASANLTFDTICASNPLGSPLMQALIRLRQTLMSGKNEDIALPSGFIEQLTALGWSVISRNANREIVLGSATQPWTPNPTFRKIEASAFTAFNEPGYAKIAVAISSAPTGPQTCTVSTQTRVQTTDADSRNRFRRYWSLVLPGIELIRVAQLHQIKRDAEAGQLTQINGRQVGDAPALEYGSKPRRQTIR